MSLYCLSLQLSVNSLCVHEDVCDVHNPGLRSTLFDL